MEEKQTPQPDTQTQTQEAIDLANSVAVEKQQAEDVAFFNSVAERARHHVDVVDANTSDSEPVTVNHRSMGKKLLSVGLATGVAIGAGAVAAGPVGDVIDQHFTQVEENNKQWAEEARKAEQKMIQDGVITIDVPQSDSSAEK